MAGVAATSAVVVCGTRDVIDWSDLFICLDARTGEQKWKLQYPALPPPTALVRDGKLDFGNAPRACPLICDDRVVTLGAFGDVHCVELETGHVLWSCNLLTDYGGSLPAWGYSGSPLALDQWIVLQPGGKECSLLALRLEDGEPIWETPGCGASYSSLILATWGGQRQVVGMDAQGLGGWDAASGERLWEIKPERGGEFLVPTPVLVGNRLLVTGENNGTRIFELSAAGRPTPTSVARSFDCRPDTHTPVLMGDFVVALQDSLLVMRADTLALHQEIDHEGLSHYGSLISDGRGRLLVFTDRGRLLLYEMVGQLLVLRGSLSLTSANVSQIYSHPAIVGNLFFCIVDSKLGCLEFR